jgi:hypothetical protein
MTNRLYPESVHLVDAFPPTQPIDMFQLFLDQEATHARP